MRNLRPTARWIGELIALGQGCYPYVNPGSFAVLLPLIPSRPAWPWSFPLPDDARLIGAFFARQAVFAPTGAPLGIDFSNAVHVRIGR